MSYLKEGKKKEERFVEDFSSFYEVTSIETSTPQQDMKDHYDKIINGVKYDIKGIRKIGRNDPFFNEHYHWVELRNVHGKRGSLYGKADCFAFELNEYWIIVDKVKLQNFVADKVTKEYVTNPDEALYCFYRREGRLDTLTLVKTIDLILIADKIINKCESNKIVHTVGESIVSEIREKQRISKLFDK